jgi:hypothetical protein
MTKDEVVSKVRKLLELSRSSNENEAALAAAKARELLSGHNLSLADLPSDRLEDSLFIVQSAVDVGKVIRNWVKGLHLSVAIGFQCEPLVRRKRGAAPLLTFIGTDTDAEVAVHTFLFLYDELGKLANSALPRLKRDNGGWATSALRYAYLDGAVQRINERFHQETSGIKTREQSSCKDLVLAKDRLIQKYIEKTFACVHREYSRGRAVSAGAFQRGYRDAGSLDIRPGRNGGADRPQELD